MQIFGSAYLGPLSHYFHILLDKIFKGKKDPKTVAKKVLPILVLTLLVYYFWIHHSIQFLALIRNTYVWHFWYLDKWIALSKLRNETFQVVLEQLTISPWNNLMFMIYYGLVIEGEFTPQPLSACNIFCSCMLSVTV